MIIQSILILSLHFISGFSDNLCYLYSETNACLLCSNDSYKTDYFFQELALTGADGKSCTKKVSAINGKQIAIISSKAKEQCSECKYLEQIGTLYYDVYSAFYNESKYAYKYMVSELEFYFFGNDPHFLFIEQSAKGIQFFRSSQLIISLQPFDCSIISGFSCEFFNISSRSKLVLKDPNFEIFIERMLTIKNIDIIGSDLRLHALSVLPSCLNQKFICCENLAELNECQFSLGLTANDKKIIGFLEPSFFVLESLYLYNNSNRTLSPTLNLFNVSFIDLLSPSSITTAFKSLVKIRTLAGVNINIKNASFLNFGLENGLIILEKDSIEEFFIKRKFIQNILMNPDSVGFNILIKTALFNMTGVLLTVRDTKAGFLALLNVRKALLFIIIIEFSASKQIFQDIPSGGVCLFYFYDVKANIEFSNISLSNLAFTAFLFIQAEGSIIFKDIFIKNISLQNMNFIDARGKVYFFIENLFISNLKSNNTNLINLFQGEVFTGEMRLHNVEGYKIFQLRDWVFIYLKGSSFENMKAKAYFLSGEDSMISIGNSSMLKIEAEFNIFYFLNSPYNFTQIIASEFISESAINPQVLRYQVIDKCVFTNMTNINYFISPGGIFYLFLFKASSITNSKFVIFFSNYVPTDFDKAIVMTNITFKQVLLHEYLFEMCCLVLIVNKTRLEEVYLDKETGRSLAALEVGECYYFSDIEMLNIGVEYPMNIIYSQYLYHSVFFLFYSPIFLINFRISISKLLFLPTGLISSSNPSQFIILNRVKISILHSNPIRNFKALIVSYPKFVLILDCEFKNMQCSKDNLGVFHESGLFTIFNYPHFGGERRNDNRVIILNSVFNKCECQTASGLLLINFNSVIIMKCFFTDGTSIQSGFLFIMASFETIFFDNNFLSVNVENSASFMTLSQVSDLLFMKNVFANGFAAGSGALFLIRVDNCLISNISGFNISSSGEGGFFLLDESKLNIFDSEFANISSRASGGLIYSQALCEVNFKNVKIFNSSAKSRGTAYFEDTLLICFENTVIENSYSEWESSVLEASSFNNFTMVTVTISFAFTRSKQTIHLRSSSFNQYLYLENIIFKSSHAEDMSVLFFNTLGNIIIKDLRVEECTGQSLIVILAKTDISIRIDNLVFFSNTVKKLFISEASQTAITNLNVTENIIYGDLALDFSGKIIFMNNSYFLLNKIELQSSKSVYMISFKDGIVSFQIENQVFHDEQTLIMGIGLLKCGGFQCGNFLIRNLSASVKNNEGLYLILLESGNLRISESTLILMEADFIKANSVIGISMFDIFLFVESPSSNRSIVNVDGCSLFRLEQAMLILSPSSNFGLKNVETLKIVQSDFFRRKSKLNESLVSYLALEEISNIYIMNSIFFRGQADEGGCFFLRNSKIRTVSLYTEHSFFIENKAFSGGAVHITGYEVILNFKNLLFFSNQAINGSANISNDGIGAVLYVWTSSNDPSPKSLINQIIFANNFADYFGPALLIQEELIEDESNLYYNNKDGLGFTNESSSGPTCIKLISRNESVNLKDKAICEENKLNLTINSGVPINISFELVNKQGILLIYENSVRAYLKSRDRAVVLSQQEVFSENGVIRFTEVTLKQKPETWSQISLFLEFGKKNSNGKTKEFQFLVYSPACADGEILTIDLTCTRCSPGTFSSILLASFQANDSLCSKCLNDFICFGGSLVFPAKGFWRFRNSSNLALKCIIPSACNSYTVSENDENEKAFVEAPCAQGHSGNLCNECDKGYGKFQKNKLCVSCEENRGFYIMRIVLFCVGLCFYIFGNAYFFSESLKERKTNKSPFIVFKILVNHMQLISIINAMENINNIPYIEDFSYLEYYISFISEDIISIDCLMQKYIDEKGPYFLKVFITLLLPLAFGVISIFLWMMLLVMYYIFRFKKGRRSGTLQKILVAITICTYILYPMMVQKIFSLTNCMQLIEDTNDRVLNSYLYESPNIRCWEGDHMLYFYTIFIPSLFIWGVFFPWLLYRILRKNFNIVNTLETLVSSNFKSDNMISQRKSSTKPPQLNMNKRSSIFKVLQADTSDIEKKLRESRIFRFFYEDYKPGSFYWEIVIFMKKFFLTMCMSSTQIIGLDTNSILQILIIVCYCNFLIKYPPFHLKLFNLFDLCSNIIAIFTKLLILLSNSQIISRGLGIFMFLFILLINCLWIVSLGYYFIKLLKRRREKIKIAKRKSQIQPSNISSSNISTFQRLRLMFKSNSPSIKK